MQGLKLMAYAVKHHYNNHDLQVFQPIARYLRGLSYPSSQRQLHQHRKH